MRSISCRVALLAAVGVAAAVGPSCARERPLLSVSGPRDLVRLEVRVAGGEVLWVIESEEPTPLRSIYYGAVPEGYRQTVPADGGPPRPFLQHEPVRVYSATPTRAFIHWGTASSPAEMDIYDWKTWLLRLQPEDFDLEEELENPPQQNELFLFEVEGESNRDEKRPPGSPGA